MASSPPEAAPRGVRSVPALLYGLGLLNFGIAVVVAEASPLSLAATCSFAAMTAGAGALVVIVAAARDDHRSAGQRAASGEPGNDDA